MRHEKRERTTGKPRRSTSWRCPAPRLAYHDALRWVTEAWPRRSTTPVVGAGCREQCGPMGFVRSARLGQPGSVRLARSGWLGRPGPVSPSFSRSVGCVRTRSFGPSGVEPNNRCRQSRSNRGSVLETVPRRLRVSSAEDSSRLPTERGKHGRSKLAKRWNVHETFRIQPDTSDSKTSDSNQRREGNS